MLVDESVLILNGIEWEESQEELFPEAGLRELTSDMMRRLVGLYSPEKAILLGQRSASEPTGLLALFADLGVDATSVPSNSTSTHHYGDLSVGNLTTEVPSVSGGESPEREGQSCFVLEQGRLIMPKFTNLGEASAIRSSELFLVSSLA